MRPILPLFLAAFLLSAPSLAAQSQMRAANVASAVQQAASDNQFAILSSRLALQRSHNPNVRAFARRMVADHTAIERRMMATLAQAGIPRPRPVLDPVHRAELRRLQMSSGAAFDRLYLAQQLNAHAQAVARLSAYARQGTNPALRKLAASVLPAIRQHLAMLQRLEGGRQISAAR